MALLNIGDNVPDLNLLDQSGNSVSLKEITKNLTLIYFYPKAMTSGCTTQACGIRDGESELKSKNISVYGVSPDAPKKLQKFIERDNLNFTLLADENHEACEQFGVWGLKKMCDKEYYGVNRISFLAKDNKIVAVFPKVKPKEHLDMILKYVEEHNLA